MGSASLSETECHFGIRLVRGRGVTHDFPRHVHQSMLFIRVIAGSREIDVSGRTWQIVAGQGCCLPSGCAHACRSIEPHDYDAVSVPLAVWEALRETDDASAIFTVLDAQETSDRALRHLIAVLRADPDPMAIESALLDVLAFVQSAAREEAATHHQAMVNQVRTYLQSHFAETVRLSDLAEMTGWSASMVNRIFSAQVGVPPYEFLLHQRLREVARRLRNSPLALADIAVETGFADQSHMQRLFRRAYGVTPKAYRQGATMHAGITLATD